MADKRVIGRRRWTVEYRTAPDESGDMIVDLPADFLSATGFEIGDEFSIEIAEGAIILTRYPNALLSPPLNPSPAGMIKKRSLKR